MSTCAYARGCCHTRSIYTLSQGSRSFIFEVSSMKDVCGWSGVSQGFVLGRVQLFVSATFKANVHEHEHEASWVTSPLRGSTMVIPIIHSAQSSCRISYTGLRVCASVRVCSVDLHVWVCKGLSVFAALSMYIHVYLCVHYLPCVSMHVIMSISLKLLLKIDLHFHPRCCPHLACLCVM